MKERGTWYVPTLSAGIFVAEKAKVPGYFPDIVRPKAEKVGAQIRATAARAHKAGVKIAFGTDAGVGPHGANARELVYLTEAGLTPAQALRAATTSAAEVLGAKGELGCVAAGCYADLVGVALDPRADVSILQAPDFVMKGGEVILQH
jgi:imidazolonepropionase-like amidohydrolase